MIWLLALLPVYVAFALVIARFCHLNQRLDDEVAGYFQMLAAERRAEEALSRARRHSRRNVPAPDASPAEQLEEAHSAR
jgi:hypothetical protein